MKLSKVIKVILGAQLLIMSFAGMCQYIGAQTAASNMTVKASGTFNAPELDGPYIGIFCQFIQFTPYQQIANAKSTVYIDPISQDHYKMSGSGKTITCDGNYVSLSYNSIDSGASYPYPIGFNVSFTNKDNVSGIYRIGLGSGKSASGPFYAEGKNSGANLGGTTVVGGQCGVDIPDTLSLGSFKRGTTDAGGIVFPLKWDEGTTAHIVFTGSGNRNDVDESDPRVINVGGKESGVKLKIDMDQYGDNLWGISAGQQLTGSVTVSADAEPKTVDSLLTATISCY